MLFTVLRTCPLKPQLSVAVPAFYKLLHKFKVGSGNVEEKIDRLKDMCKTIDVDLVINTAQWDDSFYEFRIFGVPWEPMEFVHQAKTLQHPLKVLLAIPKVLKESVDRNLQTDFVALAKRRLKFVLHWNARAKQLQAEEAALRSSMDKLVAEVTRSKRICLFSEMLASAH